MSARRRLAPTPVLPLSLGLALGLARVLALLADTGLAAVALGADSSPLASVAPLASAVPVASAASELVLEAGDLRSEGSGPGLVGNPLLILGGVVLLGVLTAAATVVLARLTRRA